MKRFFLIFASLLVLTACGQEEEKKEKDNKTETTKKTRKKKRKRKQKIKRIKLKKTQIIMTNKAMNSKIIK